MPLKRNWHFQGKINLLHFSYIVLDGVKKAINILNEIQDKNTWYHFKYQLKHSQVWLPGVETSSSKFSSPMGMSQFTLMSQITLSK